MGQRTELPGTLKRSPAKAQRTWRKTHDHAVREYGEGARAHRTAYSALKHAFKKSGDHWEPKKSKGPSDPRAAHRGRRARSGKDESFGGVDYYGSTKSELYEQAKELDIAGRSSMDKKQLARAIARRQ